MNETSYSMSRVDLEFLRWIFKSGISYEERHASHEE